jgi:fructosamine-3-kinase
MLRVADTHTLRIPKVYYYGSLSCNPGGGTSIIMEYLDFSSGSDQAALGTQLARMHLADLKVLGARPLKTLDADATTIAQHCTFRTPSCGSG